MNSTSSIKRSSFFLVVAALAASLCLAFSLAACSGDNSGEAEAPVDPSKMISVHVTVDGTEAGQKVFFDDTVQVPEGSSAFDALEATKLEVLSKKSLGMGIYVAGIEGLMEKEKAPTSGWLFAINGETASLSSDAVEVADGDEMLWAWKLSGEME